MTIDFEDLHNQELEIFIQYKYLDNQELINILSNLNKLYSEILNITSPVYIENDIAMRNFMEISSINTGESIRLKFKEGWKPELSLENRELNIKIPKKLGVPALILFFLLNSYKIGIGTYNDTLDNQLKRLDIKIKEIELYEKLKKSKTIKTSERSIIMQANKTIRYFIENEDITHVFINEVEILPLETLSPENVIDYIDRGFDYLNLKQYEKALDDLNKAIYLDPNNAVAYHIRGIICDCLMQYEKAINDFNKSIELDPNIVNNFRYRGVAYAHLGQKEKAIADLSIAIHLDPNDAAAYPIRGIIYSYLNQHEKAIEDLNKSIELDPKNVNNYISRGQIYSNLKQYHKTIEDYNKAIDLDPKNIKIIQNNSKLKIITGNYESALDSIKKGLSLSLEIENKAIFLYLKCIAEELLGMDTSVSKIDFNEILKENFTLTWNFNEIESWLKDADIDDNTKKFIKEKTELFKKYLK